MRRLGGPAHWWLVVLAATGWSVAYLEGQGVLRVLIPAAFAVCLAQLWRAPVAAAFAVGMVQATGLLLGVPATSPSGLAAGLVSLTVLGMTTRWRTALPVVLFFLAVVVATGLSPVRTAVGLFLFLACWLMADQVRRWQDRLRTSRRRAARLTAEDPRAAAERVVATERALLVARAAEVVRSTLTRVRQQARAGDATLDPRVVDEVRESAVAGIDELRDLLDLVRHPPPPPGDEAPGAATEAPGPRPAWVADLALAAGALAVGTLDVVMERGRPDGTTLLLVGLLAGSLALRGTWPALATLVATAGMLAAFGAGAALPHGLAEAGVLVVLTWTVVTRNRPHALAALALLLLATLAVTTRRQTSYDEVAAALVLATATLAWVRRRVRADHESLAARVARLEGDSAAVVQRALAEDRIRLARDLHDVVGHALGVMVVQAGAAVAACERDPAAAREALRHVAATGDEALAELATLDTGTGLARASLQESVDALADRVRAAGLMLRVAGELDLPPGTVTTVLYRVVQESVTNALKHAPGSVVRLALADQDGTAVVEVVSDPSRVPAVGPGSRSGLVGMAARVRAAGGVLESGPRPDGGFAVRARVPYRVVEGTAR